jgi:F-type H+-transporting ATPase subunit alpha
MTDGQIYMNTVLVGEGFKPAIDMGLSVSRIGSKVQWPAMKEMVGMLQLEFVRYKELERLTRIKAGVSAGVEERLKHGKILEEVLKQDQNAPIGMEDQVIVLYALEHDFLKGCEPAEVRGRLDRLVKQVRANRPDVIEEMVKTRQLTSMIREGLDEQIAQFSNSSV